MTPMPFGPAVVLLRLQRLVVQARLLRAERAIDRHFSRQRSLVIDGLVIELERVARRRIA